MRWRTWPAFLYRESALPSKINRYFTYIIISILRGIWKCARIASRSTHIVQKERIVARIVARGIKNSHSSARRQIRTEMWSVKAGIRAVLSLYARRITLLSRWSKKVEGHGLIPLSPPPPHQSCRIDSRARNRSWHSLLFDFLTDP